MGHLYFVSINNRRVDEAGKEVSHDKLGIILAKPGDLATMIVLLLPLDVQMLVEWIYIMDSTLYDNSIKLGTWFLHIIKPPPI